MKVDKGFLEKILQEPISDFKLSAGTKPGDNVAGSLESIEVTLSSGKKLHLVNKTYPDDPEFKGYAIQFGLFLTENTMYQIIGPRVEALLKSKGVPAQQANLLLPKFIAGNGDMTQGDEFLCLEDVRPLGYIMPNKFTGLNLTEVSLILKELGNYHASTYYWIKYEGDKIFEESKGLKQIRNSPFNNEDPQMKLMGTEMFSLELQNAVTVLQHAKANDLAEKVTKILNRGKDYVYDLLMTRGRSTDVTTFPCIVHGDLWVNNIMMKYDKEGNPVGLKFLDFQQTRRGNIYEDLVYFILTSTTPAFRQKHLVQVLNLYYEAFASTLRAVGCPLPLGFSRGILIDTFYSQLLAGFVYMAFAIPMQLADPIDSVAEAEAMKEQMAQAGSGPPPDPSQMTMEQTIAMMKQGLEMRSKKLLGQMMKSPRAIDRLVDITKEMAELQII